MRLPPSEPLRHSLLGQGYERTCQVPAFPTRGFCPWQNLWFERRLRQHHPLPLGLHSHPQKFLARLPEPARHLYELLYLHRAVPSAGLDLPPGAWLPTPSAGRVQALWQLTAVAVEKETRLILSSIAGRSPGQFVYLGDDSGLLIEAAWKWLRGRGQGRALDLCCGCGVIGLCLPPGFDQILGLDANADAIEVARFNADLNLSSGASFQVSDMLTEADGEFDFIVGNPPALPLKGQARSLLYAFGGENPAHLTLEAVRGICRYLAPGGRALLLSFSVRNALWEQLQKLVPVEVSLSYRPRRHIPLEDATLGWMEHCWIQLVRDGQGRRQRQPMSWWDRALSWSVPGVACSPPLQLCYAGKASSAREGLDHSLTNSEP